MADNLRAIKIRVDADSVIGLGHIMRCISLAHMLKDNFAIHFYSMGLSNSIKREVTKYGWKCTILENESGFFGSLSGNETVVLDGYHLDSAYQKKIKQYGSTLVCIDDLHEEYFYADLIINHAPGIQNSSYKGEEYSRYLLGPDYALLRPEFLEEPKKKESRDTIKNLFICFGGSDVNNVTTKILTWLPKKNYSVSVVVGSAYKYKADLNQVIEQRDDLLIEIHDSLTAQEMKEELEKVDLAIVPASGILIEAISRNIPVISGYYIKNQKLFYYGFRNHCVFIDAGNFTQNKFDEAFHRAEHSDLDELLRNQRKIIDFSSGERILTQFKALS